MKSLYSLIIFLLVALTCLFYITYACDEQQLNHIKQTNPLLYHKLIRMQQKRHHHHNHNLRNLHHHFRRHNRRSHVKRCQYSDQNVKENNINNQNNNKFASKGIGTYKPYNFVKHHQIRDGQERPYYTNSHSYERKSTDESETESRYVNIGDAINLTCSIDTREVDWHFKDTNLTTTILSYGLQLQVRQKVIYNQNNDALTPANDYHFPSNLQSEQTLKYRLNSDKLMNHQMTLYVESSKDEGSYQCVDSTSETPVKKTIHVILKTNSGALMSGFKKNEVSIIFYLIFTLFLIINIIYTKEITSLF